MGIHLFLIHIVYRMLYPVTVLLTRNASYYGVGKAFTHVSKWLDVSHVIRMVGQSIGWQVDCHLFRILAIPFVHLQASPTVIHIAVGFGRGLRHIANRQKTTSIFLPTHTDVVENNVSCICFITASKYPLFSAYWAEPGYSIMLPEIGKSKSV